MAEHEDLYDPRDLPLIFQLRVSEKTEDAKKDRYNKQNHCYLKPEGPLLAQAGFFFKDFHFESVSP